MLIHIILGMFEVRSVGYEFDRRQLKGCSALFGMVSNEKI
jgi:hypothetical protein